MYSDTIYSERAGMYITEGYSIEQQPLINMIIEEGFR